MIQIFGIKNCDTMKKAFRWLDENNIEYAFHDYKKAGLNEATAKAWINTMGWENIINKRGTTWRKLDEEIKSSMNNDNAMHLMVTQPSIIKRPLVIAKGSIHLGFSPEEYANLFLA